MQVAGHASSLLLLPLGPLSRPIGQAPLPSTGYGRLTGARCGMRGSDERDAQCLTTLATAPQRVTSGVEPTSSFTFMKLHSKLTQLHPNHGFEMLSTPTPFISSAPSLAQAPSVQYS